MLNIGASGSIKPYVKFNAKADKWFAKAGPVGSAVITKRHPRSYAGSSS
jgi:hypothetical protein